MDNKFVISHLKERLQDLPATIVLKTRLRNQVRKVTNKLALLQYSLEDADENVVKNEQWMAKLLKAIYSVEDAMDTFIMRTAVQRRRQNGFKNLQCLASFRSQSLFINEMKKLITNVGNLSKHSLDDNNVPESSSGSYQGCDKQQHWRKTFAWHLDEDRDVVGLEDLVGDMADRLDHLNYILVYPCRSNEIVVVVDEGGTGKKTLARSIYNRFRGNPSLKCAWIHVPEKYKVRDILVDMLRQIDYEREELPFLELELRRRIAHILEFKLSTIVLDDVRTLKVWEAVKCLFAGSMVG